MQETLENEFTQRMFIHQSAILGGYLMNEYMERESKKGGVLLPEFIIKMQADEYSNKVMEEAIKEGTFIAMYEEAWKHISKTIPENFSVL